ncbi:hypothetical protein CYMTET_33952, partial [Cymbomonas tetramitiformis]
AWDFIKINDAEAAEDSTSVEIAPLEEVLVGPDVKIKGLVFEGDHYIVQDESGFITRVATPGYTTKKLVSYHSGGIVGLGTSSKSHICVTAGVDGTVRLWDYVATRMLYSRKFLTPCSVMCMVPEVVDPTGRQVAVGFEEGTVRILSRCADEWKLIVCLKPHKSAVTVLAFSPDGNILATASKDKTIFFFNISEGAYEPIAFITISAPITAIGWKEDSTKFLVGCNNGDVIELMCPRVDVDTSKTFEIDLPAAFYEFKRPKPKKVKEAEKEGEEGEGEGEKKEGEEGEEGEKKDGEEGAEDGEEKEEEEEEPEEEDPGGYAVCTISYIGNEDGNSQSFCMTLEGKAAGYVYECSFESEEVIGVSPSLSAPCGVLKLSHSGKFILSGSFEGTVRVQPLAPISEDSVAPSGRPKYWEFPVHDGHNGRLTGVELSFDDAYLLSVAMDGSFFVQQFNLPDDVTDGEQMGDTTAVPKAALDPAEEAVDITSRDTYSIEEAKQKTEEDNLIQAAEEKKMGMRRYLQTIRDEFSELLSANERRAESERLAREEFEIDPGLRTMIETETAEKMNVARLELQWESEKKAIALKKLKGWFLDNVEVERIVLRPFRGAFKVLLVPANFALSLSPLNGVSKRCGVGASPSPARYSSSTKFQMTVTAASLSS